MKKEEIGIATKSIVLGVFDSNNWLYFRNRGCIGYGRFYTITGDCNSIIEKVERACELASQIIFCLDMVYFPIDINESVTCSELQLICNNTILFNKTIFVKGDNVIQFDKNLL